MIYSLHLQISKAVEAEVARRLAERERGKDDEEEERRSRGDRRSERSKSRSPKKEQTLPPGILTPLLKRHKDLDDELKSRLQELENKLCVFASSLF